MTPQVKNEVAEKVARLHMAVWFTLDTLAILQRNDRGGMSPESPFFVDSILDVSKDLMTQQLDTLDRLQDLLKLGPCGEDVESMRIIGRIEKEKQTKETEGSNDE